MTPLPRPLFAAATIALLAAALHAQPAPAPNPLADCDGPATVVLQPAAAGAAQLVDGDKAAATPRTAAPAEARAVWLDARRLLWPGLPATGRYRLYHAAAGQMVARAGAPVQGSGGALELTLTGDALGPGDAAYAYLPPGVVLALRSGSVDIAHLLRGQLLAVHEDAQGHVLQATGTQLAGALDDRYASADASPPLGATPAATGAVWRLWAPTARAVSLCMYARGDSAATQHVFMRFDADTGVWSYHAPQRIHSLYYTYLVEVYVPGLGVVRNRVADPYSLSATTDSQRSYLADLDSPALMPRGWRTDRAPRTVQASPDMSIYELHVRDFSIADASVRPAWRGKYLAFTEPHSAGMRHLRALARAGITDVHLLPVFDFGSVPEAGCVTPHPQGSGDSEAPQAVVGATRDIDCYNWGYDPVLYSAPEGSYASDAADGARRVVELRAMVQALHRAGLRVGMDVVYNHTYAAGQAALSVLDRIVPGYYHRLSESGAVEQSTCCANTATEHRMMARLMIDSVLGWATHYHIDSFRFDLMGHQPRAVMQRLQQRLRAATGHDVPLIGEGWNFGEVADGRRFVQASQLSLGGTGIGTFSDRARDALRGGGPGGQGLALRTQGYINGRVTDPNRNADPRLTEHDLACTADLVRVGLAGTLAGYRMRSCDGSERTLHELPYNGQPAGYASAPGEVVNYVENHDNHTLFDANVLKLPRATSHVDRVRVQMLGAALVALSQGVAYFHAGIDTLRSKSLDRNSFNSGDWFNRIDWSYRDNNFARGAPPAWDNVADYAVDKPLLRDPGIAPRPRDIALARDMFADLLRIRRSSTLFHLRSAQDVQQRLRFDNTGAQQNARVVVGHLRGAGYPGARFRELLYLVNVDKAPQSLALPQERGKRYVLHPVQASPRAADARPRQAARYDAQHGRFTLPARSTVIYVVY